MNDSFDETNLPKVKDESKLATPAELPMTEIQLRIARENPRDEIQIAKRLVSELVAHADYADEGFFSIPYKDNRKGLISFVEGLTIRAAEHCWIRWGNATVGARVADDRGNKIMVQGMFFDYETGLHNLSDLEVSKMGKTRNGGTYPLDDAKLRLAIQSAESKVKRNAFLGGLPFWIKKKYLTTCYQLALGPSDKPAPERIKAAVEFFTTSYKVAPKDVLALIEKVRESYPGIKDEELLRYLIGLKNAIRDGNADMDFIFGEDRKPPALPQEKKKEIAAALVGE